MTVLTDLIAELRTAHGPIRSNDLAHRIGVSEPALDGMIAVLAANGVLAAASDHDTGANVGCSGVGCGTTCVGLSACPFIAKTPSTYSLVIAPISIPPPASLPRPVSANEAG